MIDKLKILIVSEHASAQFGGEAALPLHYYRVLRSRDMNVWLLVHERTREELMSLYPNDSENIVFVSDTIFHKTFWRMSQVLPPRLAGFTTGFLMRVATQLAQRPIIKKMISELHINLIHQPMPVSPKEPSLIFGFGVPVVIGPMNGGIDYPPAFSQMQGKFENWTLAVGRYCANLMNWLIAGKRKAACLLVANERTKFALSNCLKRVPTEILVENGVDLTLWRNSIIELNTNAALKITHYVYMGRLVNWKAVDILLSAFADASKSSIISLEIIGDGVERVSLEQRARSLGIFASLNEPRRAGMVQFTGWLSQVECARRLRESDALVLPSLLECGGAVVLEAMAMSVPVIATNWGGPPDYLDDSCGILLSVTTKERFLKDLTYGLVKLANNARLRIELGKAARLKVMSDFDWEIKVNAIIKIYLNAIKGKR